ncbi:MAG: histidine phosphatase family protein [Shewanella sp.]
MQNVTQIELLRHGLPEGSECFRGHVDFPITERGLKQMWASIDASQTAEVVISSSLQRCQRFAREYSDRHDIPLVVKAEFMELNFGDWDGKLKQDVWETDQDTLKRFWSSPWQTTPPRGESIANYDSRLSIAWNSLLAEFKGKRILLVTHGGVIKQLLRILLKMPKSAVYIQRLNIPYAAKIKITVYHDDDGKLWPEVHWPV